MLVNMKLTNININDSLLQFEKRFPKDTQDRLLLEEVLLNFQSHFGEERKYECSLKKHTAP